MTPPIPINECKELSSSSAHLSDEACDATPAPPMQPMTPAPCALQPSRRLAHVCTYIHTYLLYTLNTYSVHGRSGSGLDVHMLVRTPPTCRVLQSSEWLDGYALRMPRRQLSAIRRDESRTNDVLRLIILSRRSSQSTRITTHDARHVCWLTPRFDGPHTICTQTKARAMASVLVQGSTSLASPPTLLSTNPPP